MERTGKTNVLYVITKSNWGGAQRYVYDLATNLDREQFSVAVALGGTGKHGDETGQLDKKLREAGIETIFVKNFGRNISFLREPLALIELTRLFLRQKPDVVHANSSKAGGLSMLAGRLAGIKRLIFTAHGWPFYEERPQWQSTLITYFSWLTVVLSHATIVISEYDKTLLPELFTRDKLVRIYNGMAVPTFKRADNVRRRLLRRTNTEVRDDTILFGVIAELHPNKGLDTFIDAFARIRDERNPMHAFIIGDGELRGELQQHISDESLERHVTLAGFLKDAWQYLPAFDAFVLPSRKEGVPYVLLEAGTARTPVIASHTGGIPEIIEDGESGFLFDAGDAEELSQYMRKLAREPGTREMTGRSLHKRVTTTFTLNTMVQRTQQLYHNELHATDS
jgi:glycosyltransferase involved in cell wall biosynthesis